MRVPPDSLIATYIKVTALQLGNSFHLKNYSQYLACWYEILPTSTTLVHNGVRLISESKHYSEGIVYNHLSLLTRVSLRCATL